MGSYATSKIKVNKGALGVIDSMPKQLLDVAFPKVLRKLSAQMKAAVHRRLPDGDAGKNTRAKQSEKTKKRFPEKMKRNVGSKTIRDSLGLLLIVGVKADAGHVNFDHGEKAIRGTGRRHKYWGHDPEGGPKHRKQVQDIKTEVRVEFEPIVSKFVVSELNNLIRRPKTKA